MGYAHRADRLLLIGPLASDENRAVLGRPSSFHLHRGGLRCDSTDPFSADALVTGFARLRIRYVNGSKNKLGVSPHRSAVRWNIDGKSDPRPALSGRAPRLAQRRRRRRLSPCGVSFGWTRNRVGHYRCRRSVQNKAGAGNLSRLPRRAPARQLHKRAARHRDNRRRRGETSRRSSRHGNSVGGCFCRSNSYKSGRRSRRILHYQNFIFNLRMVWYSQFWGVHNSWRIG